MVIYDGCKTVVLSIEHMDINDVVFTVDCLYYYTNRVFVKFFL